MSNPQNISSVLKNNGSETLIWRGFHPFNMIRGPEEVEKVLVPFTQKAQKMSKKRRYFFCRI